MDPRRLAELRSLAYHREVARRLAEDPGMLRRARTRAAEWASRADRSPQHARLWLDVLSRPVDQIAAFLSGDDETARELRQSTPFAGALSARERWRIWALAGAQTREES